MIQNEEIPPDCPIVEPTSPPITPDKETTPEKMTAQRTPPNKDSSQTTTSHQPSFTLANALVNVLGFSVPSGFLPNSTSASLPALQPATLLAQANHSTGCSNSSTSSPQSMCYSPTGLFNTKRPLTDDISLQNLANAAMSLSQNVTSQNNLCSDLSSGPASPRSSPSHGGRNGLNQNAQHLRSCGSDAQGSGGPFLATTPNSSGSNTSANDRKQRAFIPDSNKDDRYWERRRKNNEAAKRSREKRRQNDVLMEKRIQELETENVDLRNELRELRLKLNLSVEDMEPNVSCDSLSSLTSRSYQLPNLPKKRDYMTMKNDSNALHNSLLEKNSCVNNQIGAGLLNTKQDQNTNDVSVNLVNSILKNPAILQSQIANFGNPQIAPEPLNTQSNLDYIALQRLLSAMIGNRAPLTTASGNLGNAMLDSPETNHTANTNNLLYQQGNTVNKQTLGSTHIQDKPSEQVLLNSSTMKLENPLELNMRSGDLRNIIGQIDPQTAQTLLSSYINTMTQQNGQANASNVLKSRSGQATTLAPNPTPLSQFQSLLQAQNQTVAQPHQSLTVQQRASTAATAPATRQEGGTPLLDPAAALLLTQAAAAAATSPLSVLTVPGAANSHGNNAGLGMVLPTGTAANSNGTTVMNKLSPSLVAAASQVATVQGQFSPSVANSDSGNSQNDLTHDERYRERRRRNNEAVRRCRELKRARLMKLQAMQQQEQQELERNQLQKKLLENVPTEEIFNADQKMEIEQSKVSLSNAEYSENKHPMNHQHNKMTHFMDELQEDNSDHTSHNTSSNNNPADENQQDNFVKEQNEDDSFEPVDDLSLETNHVRLKLKNHKRRYTEPFSAKIINSPNGKLVSPSDRNSNHDSEPELGLSIHMHHHTQASTAQALVSENEC